VRVHQGVLHLGAIPLHAIDDLVRVLRTTKLPPPEKK